MNLFVLYAFEQNLYLPFRCKFEAFSMFSTKPQDLIGLFIIPRALLDLEFIKHQYLMNSFPRIADKGFDRCEDIHNVLHYFFSGWH